MADLSQYDFSTRWVCAWCDNFTQCAHVQLNGFLCKSCLSRHLNIKNANAGPSPSHMTTEAFMIMILAGLEFSEEEQKWQERKMDHLESINEDAQQAKEEMRREEYGQRGRDTSREANREMGIDESLLDEDWGNK